MKIQSAVLTNGSGSIGGMTAAKNRGGLYLRARAAVTNPQTAGQTLIRESLTAISTAWRTLTETQRQGWYDWAAVNPITNVFGDPVFMTGHQAYIALNTSRIQAALPRVDESPIGFGQPAGMELDPSSPLLVIDAPDVDLTYTIKVNDSGAGDLLIYVSKPQSATTRFFKGPYNLAKVVAAVPSTNQAVALAVGDLPSVGEGQVLWVRTRETLDDGRLGAPVVFSVVATEAP